MMKNASHLGRKDKRITVTLAPGQRKLLEQFAERNGASLAFVIRYALKRFILEHGQHQLRLDLEEPNYDKDIS